MRMDIHVHHHFPKDEDMSKLTDAIEALKAEVTDTNGKLASVLAFVQGVPDLVANAVEDALEAHDVADEEAAASVDEARQSISDNVDALIGAIDANPAPEDEPAPAV